MQLRALPLLALSLTALLAACACDRCGRAEAPAGVALREGFDAPLAGWRTAVTNARPGTTTDVWRRAERDGQALLANPQDHAGHEYNLIWRDTPWLADVDVEVRVAPWRGVEDMGGGPAWRVTGGDDYYLARWNPLEDNYRVYKVVGGERTELASAVVQADPGAWHTLRARMVGDRITCWMDGAELLHARDEALAGPGGVGLWTKADAATWFDDLVVSRP